MLVLGEALVDVVSSSAGVMEYVGGSPLNVACGLARLGHDATIACWIGQDNRGAAIAAHAAAAGAHLAPGSDAATRTPVAFAQLDAAGNASYTFDLASDLPDLPDLAGYDHVHTGSIAATLEPSGTKIVATLQRAAGTTSYDANARPAIMGTPADVLGRVEALVRLSDVVKASDEDLAWLYPAVSYEDAARAWLAWGPALVVVTRGADGAAVLVPGDDEVHAMATMPVTVADTVGAGDSFMAGLLSGLVDLGFAGSLEAGERLRAASWSDVRPALVRAVATSAITVGRAGAYGPTRAEVDALAVLKG